MKISDWPMSCGSSEPRAHHHKYRLRYAWHHHDGQDGFGKVNRSPPPAKGKPLIGFGAEYEDQTERRIRNKPRTECQASLNAGISSDTCMILQWYKLTNTPNGILDDFSVLEKKKKSANTQCQQNTARSHASVAHTDVSWRPSLECQRRRARPLPFHPPSLSRDGGTRSFRVRPWWSIGNNEPDGSRPNLAYLIWFDVVVAFRLPGSDACCRVWRWCESDTIFTVRTQTVRLSEDEGGDRNNNRNNNIRTNNRDNNKGKHFTYGSMWSTAVIGFIPHKKIGNCNSSWANDASCRRRTSVLKPSHIKIY